MSQLIPLCPIRVLFRGLKNEEDSEQKALGPLAPWPLEDLFLLGMQGQHNEKISSKALVYDTMIHHVDRFFSRDASESLSICGIDRSCQGLDKKTALKSKKVQQKARSGRMSQKMDGPEGLNERNTGENHGSFQQAGSESITAITAATKSEIRAESIG